MIKVKRKHKSIKKNCGKVFVVVIIKLFFFPQNHKCRGATHYGYTRGSTPERKLNRKTLERRKNMCARGGAPVHKTDVRECGCVGHGRKQWRNVCERKIVCVSGALWRRSAPSLRPGQREKERQR